MIDNILTVFVSFALCAGYIAATGAVLWVAGLAWVALTQRVSAFKRVRINAGWKYGTV